MNKIIYFTFLLYCLPSFAKKLNIILVMSDDQGWGQAGYFGKWHLNGLKGAGVPVLAEDPYGPNKFGFNEWLTVTNFFDLNPVLGHEEGFKEFEGDSSEIIVVEALKFMKSQHDNNTPAFSVIWIGSPHQPFSASKADIEPFGMLENIKAREHHAELKAMDRSIGTLRAGLREIGIADNTIIWFNIDNGGLAKKQTEVDSVGGLKGNKGSMYEGGLRVAGIIEWPSIIKPRISKYPASTADIMPTIIDVLELSRDNMLDVIDGDSLKPLFENDLSIRLKPITFHFNQQSAAVIYNDYKIIQMQIGVEEYELYDLANDPKESINLIFQIPDIATQMKAKLHELTSSVEKSIAGKDYPSNKVSSNLI
ncbi:sulfatase-like hydrolase/transferase [Paraglaciecola sp. L3A3]|uniref:sulfatase-like hydrolase/transferase n=1 Tax=Paraglaciecola sp. L3A3 TaxID=2686358 RepID=UPI00131B4C45|nr:sulfatase-like hydrolase/transferase [Paraglaciecola sp. L3A3]